MIRVGVIGYGYWGPNIVRNFHRLDDARVVAISDRNPVLLKDMCRNCPNQRVESDGDAIINAADIDLVAIVTPVSTHFELARRALEQGKHVFVEKPLTATRRQAEELVELAEKKGLRLMVDHTFLFTGAVMKIKEIIDSGALGKIYYYDSTRINLGIFQKDVNVVWDLAPHDFSIVLYLLNAKPKIISATGVAHVSDREDLAYIHVGFDASVVAHFSVNWLSPVKVRNTLIGGQKRMLLWDDILADEKVRIYDKGVDMQTRQGMYDMRVSYRTGDMWAPRIDPTEALQRECEHCVACLMQGTRPINDGENGLEVVKMLEACDESMRNKSAEIELT